jgi:transcriptional regulator with XRE-family HTH domain
MTPFGQKLRDMRQERGVTLKAMAHAIGVSPAYLSALEHGNRGTPTWYLMLRIIGFFNVIWDESEELERLAGLSDPKVTLSTAGMNPKATEFANRLAKEMKNLDAEDFAQFLELLRQRLKAKSQR